MREKISIKNLYSLLRSHKRYTCVLGTFVVICISVSIGYAIGLSVQENKYAKFVKSFKTIRENSDKYSYINPLIGSVSAPATDVGIYSDLKNEIASYLKTEKKNGNLYAYSFYFRDFNSGLWFGSNESKDFFPASLFKLPIAIAAYRQAEDDPSFLGRQVVYTKELAERNRLIQTNSQSTLTIGQSYSVENLIATMLTASDNGAKDAVLSVLNISYIEQLFSIVSLVDPKTTKTFSVSSAKYALFLRILYGSSYLNEEHSEHILSLLTKSDFKDGMVAGIPANIAVAHKFGTYEFEETINGVLTNTSQLHDCGVVYHKEKPYLFCFMTKGKNDQILFDVISHVSSLVYSYQSSGDQ